MSSAALCVILLSSVVAADHRELAGRSGAVLVAAAGKGLAVCGHHSAQKFALGLLREQPNSPSLSQPRWPPPNAKGWLRWRLGVCANPASFGPPLGAAAPRPLRVISFLLPRPNILELQ